MFERYGGFGTVNKVVLEFYDRLLDSPVVSPYFQNIDMRRLIDHQTKFIASVMGGPASFSHEHLERVHQRFKITNDAFQEVLTLLTETLEDSGVEAADVTTVHDQVLGLKHYIVSEG